MTTGSLNSDRSAAIFKAVNWSFAVLYLAYNSQIKGPWSTNDETGRVAGATITNALGFVITGVLTLGLLVLILPNWRTLLLALKKSPVLLLLLVLGVASAGWSITPLFTLRRSVLLVFSSFAGLYLGVTFSIAEQVKLLRIVAFLIVLSCFIVMPFPDISYHLDGPVHGAFKGVFFHKNPLGRFLAFSSCLVLIGRRDLWSNVTRIGPLLAIGVLLILARSATAVMVALVMGGLIKVVQIVVPVRGRKSEFGAIAFGMGLMIPVMMAVVGREFILPLLERDASMTGRAPLWAAVVDAIARRPWFGYGLGGYFEYPFYHLEVSSAAGWNAPHAHNGFLQLLIELGLAGFVLFVLMAISCIRKTARYMRQNPGDEFASWPILYLFFLILYNITEASLVHGNNLFWILFVAVWTSLILEPGRYRRRLLEGLYPRALADAGPGVPIAARQIALGGLG